MDREQAKAHVKGQLEDYLRQKGIDTSRPFRCLNPAHNDKTPSMSIDRVANQAHCFGKCGAKYDIIDLISMDYNLDTAQAFEKAYEMYGVTLDNLGSPRSPATARKEQTPSIKPKSPPQPATEGRENCEYVAKCRAALKDNPEALHYLQARGLSPEGLGYDAEKKQVIIPYDAAGNYYTGRPIIERENGPRYQNAKGPLPLFNAESLYNESGAVFVVEGPIDALSIIEAGGEAVAISGANNYGTLLRQLDRRPTKNTLIISMDNDDPGREATGKIIEQLEGRGIKTYMTANIGGTHKDANEALTADREQLERAIKDILEGIEAIRIATREAEIEDYQKDSVASHIDAFLDGAKIDTPAISTGFTELDSVLDGGLYEGLYILGAISSLGKTTYILQLADQIAQRGQDVLIFSLEMARAELMAKSISRLTLLNCNGKTGNAKTTRGITARERYACYSRDEKQLIEDSIGQYRKYATHLYISEGLGDIGAEEIGAAVQRHISITGNKPIVIIDYLQILKAADPRSTDKQNTDKAVFQLKRISREYKIPVIGISSLNRDSYKKKISMEAFKETGAIEYSSDVLIGLQFQAVNDKEISEEMIDKEKRSDIRKIELKILKYRNGETGSQLNYDYYPMFNYFKETGKEARKWR